MTGKKKEKKEQEGDGWVKVAGAPSDCGLEDAIELPADEYFAKMKADALDHSSLGKVVDGVFRNLLRGTCEAWTCKFAALPVLLGKNSLWLQLLLTDEERVIQGKFFGLGAEVSFAKSHADADVVERSRKLFREAVPSLLQGGGADHWIFSRSLLLPSFNGSVDDAIGFSAYDPLDCLMKLPEDPPSGVRCTEAFLFFAGDFPIKDGFCSREAVLELLHELNSPEGNQKLLGFWVCAGSAKVQKEKVDELKGVHIPAKPR